MLSSSVDCYGHETKVDLLGQRKMYFRCALSLCLCLTAVVAAQEPERADPVAKTNCIPKKSIQGLWIIGASHWAFIQDDGTVLLSELPAACPISAVLGDNALSLFRRLARQPEPDLELRAILDGRATDRTLRLSGTSLGGKNLCALRPLRFGGNPLTCYLGEFVELNSEEAERLFANPGAVITSETEGPGLALQDEAEQLNKD